MKYEVTVSAEVANVRPGGNGTRTTAGIEFSRVPYALDNPDPKLLKELQADPHLRVTAVKAAAKEEPAPVPKPSKKK